MREERASERDDAGDARSQRSFPPKKTHTEVERVQERCFLKSKRKKKNKMLSLFPLDVGVGELPLKSRSSGATFLSSPLPLSCAQVASAPS